MKHCIKVKKNLLHVKVKDYALRWKEVVFGGFSFFGCHFVQIQRFSPTILKIAKLNFGGNKCQHRTGMLFGWLSFNDRFLLSLCILVQRMLKNKKNKEDIWATKLPIAKLFEMDNAIMNK